MGLKLFDPRRILKYKEYLHKQLHYLNVFEKCKDLLELSQAKQWNQPQTDEYEKLDIIITLLFAKQSCSKKYQALWVVSPINKSCGNPTVLAVALKILRMGYQ